jgi:hypothetical protein
VAWLGSAKSFYMKKSWCGWHSQLGRALFTDITRAVFLQYCHICTHGPLHSVCNFVYKCVCVYNFIWNCPRLEADHGCMRIQQTSLISHMSWSLVCMYKLVWNCTRQEVGPQGLENPAGLNRSFPKVPEQVWHHTRMAYMCRYWQSLNPRIASVWTYGGYK